MQGKYVLALDQGTTSSRCILFDHGGKIVSVAQKEFRQIFPQPGWVEHDACEIWDTQLEVMKEAMEKADATAQDIAAIGITNQRETTVIWDRETGEPVYHAIVWQCRRTADRIEQLKADGLSDYVRETTGLVPDAYFSGSKIAWILEHVPGAKEKAEAGKLLFGTIDSWLIWNLTGGKVHATDVSNASRTMLFDIRKLDWDEKLLTYFDIPKSMLPKVVMSSGIVGMSEPDVTGGEIPIAGIAGDQQSALFGQCCFHAGDVKNTYGTGCFTLMNTGSVPVSSQNGLVTTIASGVAGKVEYALEGSVFIAGAAIQWLRDEMELLERAPESERYCMEADDTGGVYLVPAFSGMGAPYWNSYARGMVTGITRGTGKAQFIRAAVESLAYQVYDLVKAMEQDSGIPLTALKVDGGASANNFLLQFQADLLDLAIERPTNIETTALGAAYLAGLAVGYWKSKEDIVKNRAVDRIFKAAITEAERIEKLKGWKKAVKCALIWGEE